MCQVVLCTQIEFRSQKYFIPPVTGINYQLLVLKLLILLCNKINLDYQLHGLDWRHGSSGIRHSQLLANAVNFKKNE